MGYFSAVPHHADRFAGENAFEDGAGFRARSEALMLSIFMLTCQQYTTIRTDT